MIYILGVGGVGSWLAEAMVRLRGPANVKLVDGDKLEEKNLDRQLFTEDQIGQGKALALGEKLKCHAEQSWYDAHSFNHDESDVLMCCVDNNPARSQVLQACDLNGCMAIVAANETHSAEAYVYLPEWCQHPELDPRVSYAREIETDETNNPARAAIGCTGEAQKQNPQLVTANFMAAALAAHLYVVWVMERRRIRDKNVEAALPHRLYQNLTRNGFRPRGETEPETQDTKGE